jgi:hypothetical protein
VLLILQTLLFFTKEATLKRGGGNNIYPSPSVNVPRLAILKEAKLAGTFVSSEENNVL